MFCDLARKSHRSFKCTGDKHSFGERNATSLLLMLLKFWGISPGSPFIKTEHFFSAFPVSALILQSRQTSVAVLIPVSPGTWLWIFIIIPDNLG